MNGVIHIDGQQAIQLLRDVVSGREGHRYQRPFGLSDDLPNCLYAHGTEPGCVIGHALHRAGATMDQLREMDRDEVPKAISLVRPAWLSLTPEARRIWKVAQTAQDDDKSWGEALDRAEAEA